MSTDADLLRESLRLQMEEEGISVTSWAKKASLPESTIRNFLSGRSETLTHATLATLARAVNVSVAALLERPSGRVINIRHEIRADEWIVIERDMREFTTFMPFDPRYPKAKRVGFVLADDSCDQVFRSGTILVCSFPLEIGRMANHGDYVVVSESDDTGTNLLKKAQEDWDLSGKKGNLRLDPGFWEKHRDSLRSRYSVRQVVDEGDDLWLTFRSSSPRWQRPIKFPKSNLKLPNRAEGDTHAAGFCRFEGLSVFIGWVVTASFRLE